MKNRSTLILISLGLLLWVLTATFDYLTLPSQSFFDWLIFKIPTKQLLFRAAVLTMFAVAGVILSRNSMNQYTKLKNSIEALEKSNNDYASLLNNLPVGVYRATVDGRILDANRQFAEILGYREVNQLQSINLNDAYVDKFDRQEHIQRLLKPPCLQSSNYEEPTDVRFGCEIILKLP